MRLLLVWSVVLVMASVSASAESFTIQVSAGADDAKVYSNFMETDAVNALFGYTGVHRCDYLARFDQVTIPGGATVDSAFVALRCYAGASDSSCHVVIFAEDTASAVSFATYPDYTSRLLTEDSVAWDNVPSMTDLGWYRTPDIVIPVQAVIDRGDWSSGNALAVFIRDNGSGSGSFRRMYQYEGGSASACSLIVHYTIGSSANTVEPRRRRIIPSFSANLSGD